MAQRPLSAERRQSLLGTALIGLCCLGTGVALAAGRAWLVHLAPPLTPNSSAAELSRNRRRSLDPDRRRDAALLLSAQAGSTCLLYTSPSPRDVEESRMPSSA